MTNLIKSLRSFIYDKEVLDASLENVKIKYGNKSYSKAYYRKYKSGETTMARLKSFGNTTDPSAYDLRERSERNLASIAIGIITVLAIVVTVGNWNKSESNAGNIIIVAVAASTAGFLRYKAVTHPIGCKQIPADIEDELTA